MNPYQKAKLASRLIAKGDPLAVAAVKSTLGNEVYENAKRMNRLKAASLPTKQKILARFNVPLDAEKATALQVKRTIRRDEWLAMATAANCKRAHTKFARLLVWRTLGVLPSVCKIGVDKNPPEDKSTVFKRLNGSKRGIAAYATDFTLDKSRVVATDLGRYSSRCTFHKYRRKLFVNSFRVTLPDGRVARFFDGQLKSE